MRVSLYIYTLYNDVQMQFLRKHELNLVFDIKDDNNDYKKSTTITLILIVTLLNNSKISNNKDKDYHCTLTVVTIMV